MSLQIAKVIVPLCALGVMFVVFIHGITEFYDAPIRPCSEHGYCGKYGQAHTLEQYEAFKTWRAIFLIIWPVGLAFLFAWRKDILEPNEAEHLKKKSAEAL
jgi:hypothetical protein